MNKFEATSAIPCLKCPNLPELADRCIKLTEFLFKFFLVRSFSVMLNILAVLKEGATIPLVPLVAVVGLVVDSRQFGFWRVGALTH